MIPFVVLQSYRTLAVNVNNWVCEYFVGCCLRFCESYGKIMKFHSISQ